MPGSTEKISVSLPSEVIRFAEQYRRDHGMKSRSEVLVEAVRALRERELADAFGELSQEYAKVPDPLVDSGVEEGLESSDEENW